MPINDIPQLKPVTVVPEEVPQPKTSPIQKNKTEDAFIPKLGLEDKKEKRETKIR